MSNGPEDRVLEDLWTSAQPGGRFSIRVGEVAIPITHWVVWFPYLILLVVVGIGLIVFLPTELAEAVLASAFGWIGLLRGDISVATVGSLLGVLVGLALTFLVYAQLFKVTVGWLSGPEGR